MCWTLLRKNLFLTLPLLGLTLTSDLKWNVHIESVLRKASKRFYLLRNLRRSGCPYPSFCNLPNLLQEKLLKFERRAFRIIGEKNEVSWSTSTVLLATTHSDWCLHATLSTESKDQKAFQFFHSICQMIPIFLLVIVFAILLPFLLLMTFCIVNALTVFPMWGTNTNKDTYTCI